jgi:hypothetical protein
MQNMQMIKHKWELYELSEDLILAYLDENWEEVLNVARRLGYLSGYGKLIEPFWGNPQEFFALEVST